MATHQGREKGAGDRVVTVAVAVTWATGKSPCSNCPTTPYGNLSQRTWAEGCAAGRGSSWSIYWKHYHGGCAPSTFAGRNSSAAPCPSRLFSPCGAMEAQASLYSWSQSIWQKTGPLGWTDDSLVCESPPAGVPWEAALASLLSPFELRCISFPES